MAQISSNWTAPTFSFDEADQPHAWEIFYLTSQDYLEVLRIKPAEEDKEKRGWEQITQMFTGGKQTDTSEPNRQQQNYRNRPTNTNTSPKSHRNSNQKQGTPQNFNNNGNQISNNNNKKQY